MLRFRFVLLLVALPIIGFTQDRNEGWIRLNLNHWIQPKLGVGLELHHRRQANYWTTDKNLLDESMLTIVRPWIYFRLPSKWVLSSSPISYHGTREILNAQGQTKDFLELRSTYGIQRTFQLKKLISRNRAWYELRFSNINQPNYFFHTRLRIQNTWLVPLFSITKKTKLNYNFTNEFFISQRKELVQFDHNRFFNGLQVKWGPQEISLGYQWSRHNSNPRAISRNQLFLNTSFDL
ncbi:MAG: hypothetical protein RIT05_1469 [Bacteroidota bacterium]|jgi:hypothetical protein